MTLKDTVSSMKKLLGEIIGDMDKSLAGNKAASQRVRVNTIRLEKISKNYRKESVAAERKAGGKFSVKKGSAVKKSGAKRATAKVPKKKR